MLQREQLNPSETIPSGQGTHPLLAGLGISPSGQGWHTMSFSPRIFPSGQRPFLNVPAWQPGFKKYLGLINNCQT